MKRLVLCFDGTWNAIADPKTVTNVVRLANMVTVSTTDGTDQISYYNSGVGSGGPLDRFLGGAFGAGLKSNVKRGLAFLALNYEEGDEIYLFGFSRGAYTARALAGIVGAAGIPLDISRTELHWQLYQRFAKLRPKERKLKRKGNSPELEAVEKEMATIRQQLHDLSRNEDKPVPITCVGVWDTVGSYGVPGGFSGLSHAFTYWVRGFRDTQIGKAVKLGLHAVAIDEMRRPFSPTFWTLRPGMALQAQEVEQMWFPGVHSNVGGGYDRTGLSDMALAWMIARVAEKTGLEFNPSAVLENVWPCSACTIYRTSYGRPFGKSRIVLPRLPSTLIGRAWHATRRFFGLEPRVQSMRVNEEVHWSVQERCGWDTALVDGRGALKYSPPNLVSPPAYSEMLELERMLVDRNHVSEGLPAGLRKYSEPFDVAAALAKRNADWDSHCSLQQANLKCQCKERYASAAPAGQSRAA